MGHPAITGEPDGGGRGSPPPGADTWPPTDESSPALPQPVRPYPDPLAPDPDLLYRRPAPVGMAGSTTAASRSEPGGHRPEAPDPELSWLTSELPATDPDLPAAGSDLPAADPAGADAGPVRWRPGLGMIMIAVPVFVAVTLGVVAVLSTGPDDSARVPRTAAPADQGEAPQFVDPANAREATAPLQGLDEATFDLISDTTAVRLEVTDLGERLYRISTPPGANVLPRPEVRRDRVLLHLIPSGDNGPGSVDIELNSRVRWDLRFTGGATERSLDLAEGRLAGVEFVGGTARIELALPAPEGTLTVRMSGGANQFLVRAPAGPPARVRLANGAAAVTLDGRRRAGIARGTVLTSTGWSRADERFDIDLVAGVATLTVERR